MSWEKSLTGDQDIIYLDNAATTFPKPEAVYRAMDSFYRQFGGNAGRGGNPLARKAAGLVEETRVLLRAWLNAREVIFAPSATIALNTVILGARLRKGDVVLVSPFEHNSVLRPLAHLKKTMGIEIRLLPFDRHTLRCNVEAVKKQLRIERPAMMCISQVSNVLGIMLPVEALTSIIKHMAPDCITVVDAAQGAGLHALEMSSVDALVWSGHKSLYGPYGIAGVAFGTDWRPEPLLYGGTGTVSESVDMPEKGVSRFEAGSQNISAAAGLQAGLKWLQDVGRDAVVERIQRLAEHLCGLLCDLPGVTVYRFEGHSPTTGIISFSADDMRPQALETVLGAQNIAVRAGLHCSPWTHDFIGTKEFGGTVRVSIGYFNTEQDLNRCCDVIRTALVV
jgi:selenocysteine lyase/cysteine desulfurase